MKQTTVYYKISNTLINNLKHRDDIKILKNHLFSQSYFQKKDIQIYIFIVEN